MLRMEKNTKAWLAGGSASILAGLICGLTLWSFVEEQVLPDLSENPSIVSHYTRTSGQQAPAARDANSY
jgi:hypothetical protein